MGHHAITLDEANEMLSSDDPEVAYWHELSGGYAGRRRIAAEQMQRLGRLDDPARHEDSALDF